MPRDNIAALSYEATDDRPVVSTIADAARGIRAIRPDTETVLNLKPDLVVMYAGVNPRLRDNLKRLHIAVLDVPWANSLDDIRRITSMLGRAFGASDRARALVAEMDRKLDAAKRRAPRPSVTALRYEPNGYVGSGAYVDEIMRAAGLVNVAPKLGPNRAGALSVEHVVAKAPELLILGGDGAKDTALAYLVQHHPGLKALQGRMRTEAARLNSLLCPGPWSADAAATFADLARKTRKLAPSRRRR